MTNEELELKEKRKTVIYDLMCDQTYTPMKEKELAMLLQVSREDKPVFRAMLKELLTEGKIEVSSRGKYRRAGSRALTGIFLAHPRGFGFVQIEGRQEDVFIPEKESHGAFHLDTVQITLLPEQTGKRTEGTVIRVLERGIRQVVGTYRRNRNYGFVIPDNQRFLADLFIPKECAAGAGDGCKVVAEITDYGTGGKNPEGKILTVIGGRDEPGTDILSVMYSFGLPGDFPPEIQREAEKIPDRAEEREREGRLDLRDLPMVTIDGEDSRDLDDAVSLSFDGRVYRLGVHIADVSHYVREGSGLDREALKRGTSVYFPDRVIPMLPPKLSNGICSLNQGEDRLALSCLMELDREGNLLSHRVEETVVNVDRRMTYKEVAGILEEQDPALMEQYEPFVPMFRRMEELSRLLQKQRKKRGAIDFDFPEAKILLNEKGEPADILPRERNAATRLIEDFMLLSNETVAEDFYWREVPFLYRSHEAPDPEKIQSLAALISSFGYGIKTPRDTVYPKEIQKLLERAAGRPEEPMIARLALRSMKQARYTRECAGHFGLAARYYCHFTSPIRRYPDLQIHRIIKEVLHNRMTQERREHYEELLPGVAEQTSRTERTAEEAERDVDKMKKAQYMRKKIGEICRGRISGITNYGLYVELPNTIEGMVHVSNMEDDHYCYREETGDMAGVRTGKVFRMGDPVTVRVLDADPESRTIDFILAQEDEEDGQRGGKTDREQ